MSLPSHYFDALYRQSDDPWGFTDRWYEERKRALTLALLPAARYGRVFEPGCSIGALTRQLAERSDDLLAIDVSPAAVESARERCADLPQVRTGLASLPLDWPDGTFDLIVLSEVLYYLSPDELLPLARKACSVAETIVAVHWRHPVEDYPMSGDAAHDLLDEQARQLGLTRQALHLEEDLVAGVWTRDPRSVAGRTGLL